MVRVVAGFTNFILISHVHRQHVYLHQNFAVSFFLASLGVLGLDFDPESVWVIIIIKIKCLPLEWLQHILVICFIKGQWLLDERAVLNNLLEVQLSLTNHVITLEKVAVVSLKGELIILSWNCNSINKSILEVRLAVLIPVVRVSLLHIFFGIEEAAEKNITGALPIHNLHVFSFENDNTQLKHLQRLFGDIIRCDVRWIYKYRVDFEPALYYALLLRA